MQGRDYLTNAEKEEQPQLLQIVPLTAGVSQKGHVTLRGERPGWERVGGGGLPGLPVLRLHGGRSPITEDSRLILLDRWLRGLTRSLCFAAELSRQEDDSGG